MFDGIIFDVDGTLWDSTPIVKDAWNAAFADYGIKNVNITADTLKGLFGLPMDDILRSLVPGMSKEERVSFGPFCYEYEHRFLEERPGILYEGMDSTIRELHKRGFHLSIVSNCQGGYIELFNRKTGLGPCFEDHLCPADSGLLKADNIKLILERNGYKNPVYVGDTVMDFEACRKAKVPFIFASYGFGQVDDPDYVIEKAEDMLEILS